MGAHTSVEHGIPAPKRLFPKWLAPCKHTVFHHLLIAAPYVVDENIDSPGLLSHPIECSCELIVLSVVTTNSYNLRVVPGTVELSGQLQILAPHNSQARSLCHDPRLPSHR